MARTQLIELDYAPRRAFLPLHNRKARWALVVAHRRMGKTVACINDAIKAAATGKPGALYGYIMPFYRQAKNVAWAYCKQYTRDIPGIKTNEAELRIDFPSGARLQLFGADNADALRGLGFDGVICDEFGDWKPSVWKFIVRPALADRRGWAIIIGTPKGRNEFYRRYLHALRADDWYCALFKASETGVLPQDELDSLLDELGEDAFRQELECDFDAAVPGAIWGKELWELEYSGRVRKDLHDPALPVHAVLDLGYSDDTAIWWFQVADEVRVIDCYSSNGRDLAHYDTVLREKPYRYGDWLWLPHDARAKSLAANGRSIEQQFTSMGWKPRIVPELGLVDGIQAGRLTLKTCLFDPRCEEGLDALKLYQREYDEDKKMFRDQPRHDWTSHYADAFRYLSLIWRKEFKRPEPPPVRFPQDRTINEIIKRQTRRRIEVD